MACINWLHLTDLHCGVRGQQWLWPKIRAEMYSDLRKLHDVAGPWHVIFFTGDLVQSGKIEEFDEVSKELEELWKVFLELGSNPLFVSIPGNHDLLRPVSTSAFVKALSLWHTDSDVRKAFWSDAECEYRKGIEQCFSNYTNWFKGLKLPKPSLIGGLLPGDFSATIKHDNLTLGIVGLNTTFLQITGDDFEEKLDLSERQIHAVCDGDPPRWVEQNDISVLLTHQNVNWLTKEAQDRFNSEIYPPGRFFAQLCGHLHNPASDEVRKAGAQPRRLRQGPSLFGLTEYYRNGLQPRIHGYTAGRFEVRGDQGFERIWPRLLLRTHAGEYRIKPDQGYELDDVNSVTTEFEVRTRQPKSEDKEVRQLQTSVSAAPSDFGVTSSVIELSLDEAGARANLKAVPRFRVTVQPQHVAVRQEEQARFDLAIVKDRGVCVVCNWGLGKEGFLAAVLDRLRVRMACTDVFHVQADNVQNVEALQMTITQQFGMTLQQFCAAVALLPSSCVIFDGVDRALLESHSSETETFGNVLRLILDFCPSTKIAVISREKTNSLPFDAVELRPLELPEVRTYLLNHPDSTPEVQKFETVERLHEHSEGLPPHLDRMLMALKVTSLKEVIDAEIEGHTIGPEHVSKSLLQSITILARSEDQSTRRSFKLLKVLTVLANGEPMERIKLLLPGQPFRTENAIQLSSLSLLETVPLQNAVPQIETGEIKQPSQRVDMPKILRLPRQVRDCVQTLLSTDEKSEIARAAIDIFFGKKWRDGKIKIREESLDVQDVIGLGPGNEYTAVYHLLHTAVQTGDALAVRRYARLGTNYCTHLVKTARFRDACIVGEGIMHLLQQADCTEQLVEIAITYGCALRMTAHHSECVKALITGLEKGADKIPKAARASMYLDIALAQQKLKDHKAAIAAAEEVQKVAHKESSAFLQATGIIDQCTKTKEELVKSLTSLHKSARDKGFVKIANNFALELVKYCNDTDEALKLLDAILRVKDNDYNRVRAIIFRAEILVESNRTSELTNSDRLLLSLAYTYLFSQRLGVLFERCHAVVWKVLVQSKQRIQLVRMFRHSSFLWRLRGDATRELEYLTCLNPLNLAEVSAVEREGARVDLDYLERRRRAVFHSNAMRT